MTRKVGYARVSTIGQTLDSQIQILRTHHCENIFQEKASGARIDRNQLDRLIRFVKRGDVVVVTRIDRLARSTFDLFAIISRLQAKDVHFLSLAEPWADTATSTGRLMLAVLGGLADVERDLIRIRTAEGRARAVMLGTKMGRPRALSECQKDQIRLKRQSGSTLISLGLAYNVSPSTISRIKYEKTLKLDEIEDNLP
ncbi:recombinase family protein [Acetobacter indonesiensis]